MSEKPFEYYLPFEPLDFVMDDDFQSWVLHGTSSQDAYWQALSAAYPHKAPGIDTARRICRQLRVHPWQQTPPHQIHEQFQRVLNRLDAPVVPVIPFYRRASLWRAAATLLLGILGWQTYQYGWADVRYATGFGEQQRVLLTDQTVVTLAANSRLRVPGRWAFRHQREVWLTGEAYFEVTKKPGNPLSQARNFVVHARDLNVEVLGTRFNVNTFRSKTTVLLDEGKVRLSMVDRPGPVVTLQPGQQAERPVHQPGIRVAPAANPALTAWRDGQLRFSQASPADLSQRLEEVYGLRLVVDGPGWADATFTGDLPTNDALMLSRILAETFGAEVVRENNQLILRKSDIHP